MKIHGSKIGFSLEKSIRIKQKKIIPSIHRRHLKRAIEVESIWNFFVLWTNSWPTLSLLTSITGNVRDSSFVVSFMINKRWPLCHNDPIKTETGRFAFGIIPTGDSYRFIFKFGTLNDESRSSKKALTNKIWKI